MIPVMREFARDQMGHVRLLHAVKSTEQSAPNIVLDQGPVLI